MKASIILARYLIVLANKLGVASKLRHLRTSTKIKRGILEATYYCEVMDERWGNNVVRKIAKKYIVILIRHICFALNTF